MSYILDTTKEQASRRMQGERTAAAPAPLDRFAPGEADALLKR